MNDADAWNPVRLREQLARVLAVVDEQSEDEGLWFRAQYASEQYLQHELRRLHAAIESERHLLVKEKAVGNGR